MLVPFWLSGGRLARVGQRVELPLDEALVLLDIGRVRRL